MAELLSTGLLEKIKREEYKEKGVVLKVSNIELAGKKYKCTWSDGVSDMRGVLATQLTDSVANGDIHDGSVLQLNNYVVNILGEPLLLALEAVLLGSEELQPPTKQQATPALKAEKATPAVRETPTIKLENATPASAHAHVSLSPLPTPSPSDEVKLRQAKTPGLAITPTSSPGNSPLPVSQRKVYDKIDALNPYNDNFCLKVKLVRKYPVRSLPKGDKVFTAELMDDEGKQIQMSFWRDKAEKYHETLVEGSVYCIHKFQVKPANKKYSTVSNDYEIHSMSSTEVLIADDQELSQVTAAVELVPIGSLLKHVNRKAPVDVMGVVTSVGTLGTIKRKSDNSEVMRRDITIVDQTCKSVVVTLWGDNASNTATQLEGREGAIIQCAGCKVTDFSGCSLSALSRCQVTINPNGQAAVDLRKWWDREGSSASITPVGQATVSATPGAKKDSRASLKDINSIPLDQMPGENDKPLFHNVYCTVTKVNQDQTMFYLANPENGRKVTEQNGQFMDNQGNIIERAEHRFAMQLMVSDWSGEAYVSAMGKEGDLLMDISADNLAALRKDDPTGYEGACKRGQWREWVITLSSKSREYNGERRVRHTVFRAEPIDYIMECQRLVRLINAYDSPAVAASQLDIQPLATQTTMVPSSQAAAAMAFM